MKPIHLGRESMAPHLPAIDSVKPASGAKTEPKKIVTYPSLHVSGNDKEMKGMHELPEKGVMHVHYHIAGRESREKEGTKEKVHHVEIKIHKIVHAETGKNSPTGEEALDNLAKEVKANKSDEDYDQGKDSPHDNVPVDGNGR